MSERSWGEADSAPPPKKKSIPTWLWFCGGGCLLAVIIGIAAVAWLASNVTFSTDPEKLWPKVAEVLPYDERPPELEPQFGFDMGVGMYYFRDKRGFMAVLFHMPVAGDSDRDKFMNPESEVGFMGRRKDAHASKLKVQGRELDILRFQHLSGNSDGPSSKDAPEVDSGPAAMVDLTRDDQSGFLILQLVRTNSADAIGDDEITRFLEPFHVGPVR